MKKPRLLIIGCGDVVRRALPWLVQRFTVYATARSYESSLQLNTLGVKVIRADLDSPQTLSRLSGLAQYLIHSAPPGAGQGDPRTRALIAELGRAPRILPLRRAVYISTSGVYGDCGGVWIDENAPRRATQARSLKRIAAENQLRQWSRRQAIALSILRAPGIYAAERLPIARIQRGDPSIQACEDGFSNLIHADDLAHALCLALFRGLPLRAYNIADDAPHPMGDWFDLVADHHKLPRPARISREAAQQLLSPAMLSYLNESRRINNTRAKRELGLTLAYPSAEDFFAGNVQIMC